MRVRFWGVRGSVPFATDQSVRTGSNTPCIQVVDEASSRMLILDAGTGIVGFGDSLGGPPQALSILLSHYHWDHVQGLPFFSPVYRRGWTMTVAGPALADATPGWLSAVFAPPFFPVSFADLASPPSISFVESGELTVGGFSIRTLPLTHPGGSLAYRIAGATGDLVYATDHEFGDPTTDAALASFASGAAAIIMDAHFTPEELPGMKGRGHGSWTQCVDLASACGAQHLWLFHHKPGRTDDQLSAIEAEARSLYQPTSVAREGVAFTI